jgi:hypothetical protein
MYFCSGKPMYFYCGVDIGGAEIASRGLLPTCATIVDMINSGRN